MVAIQLRPYQEEAVAAAEAAWRSGMNRPGLAIPTGGGKTIVFAEIIKRSPERTLVIAHRKELIEQAAQKISFVGIDRDDIGIVMANRNEADRPIVVASLQTIVSAERRKQLGQFGLVVYDECFPAGTPIDGRAIETLVPGDTVRAFDHDSNEVVSATVLRTSRRLPSGLVRVWANGMPAFVCTPDHPVYAIDSRVGVGTYLPASDLNSWHILTEDTNAQMAQQTSGGDGRAVYRVPDHSHGVWLQTSDVRADRSSLLLGAVPGYLRGEVEFGKDGAHQSEVRIGANEQSQPDAKSGESSQDVSHAQGDWTSAGRAVWQRERTHETSTGYGASTGLGDGSGDSDRSPSGTERTAERLQSGRGQSGIEDRSGAGRQFAWVAVPASRGPEEGCVPGFAWVDRVEVLEPGSDGRFGGLCPDGHVYNLEVENHHNYFANGYLVHNCHHSVSPTALTVLRDLGVGPGLSTKALGVTATWDRADNTGLDAVWEQIVYQLYIEQLIASGHLSDIRALTIETHLDTSTIGTRGGEYDMGEVERRIVNSDYADTLAHAVLEHASDRTSLVFAPNVATAFVYRDALREIGVGSEVVSGKTPKSEREEILRRYHAGKLRSVVNVGVFTEGTDIPRVDCVVMGRPTQSRALYQQMAGRGLRLFPGKQDCLIIDLVGVTADHKLQRSASLIGRAVKSGTREVKSFREWIEGGVSHDEPGTTMIQVRGALGQTFMQQARAVDLIDRKRLSWTQVEVDAFSLPAGEQGSVVIAGQADGTYNVVQFGRETTTEIARGLDIGYAQGVAEQVVIDAEARVLANPRARWRTQPASESQIAALIKMRIEHQPGITKGEASDLMDARLNKSKLRKYRREGVAA